ncbi:MAG: Sec-independent protein translocase protein TatB [Sulfuriferula sp.]
MFDVGFSEIVVIGVVALVVIGPERLPKVARTVGLLVGRMQRYVATVKADISQEIQLDELKRSGEAFKQSLTDTEQHISNEVRQVEQNITQEIAEITDASTTPTDQEPTQVQGELALESPQPNPDRHAT